MSLARAHEEKSSSNSVKILRTELDLRPVQIAEEDLNADGKLYSAQELDQIKQILRDLPNGRYSKKKAPLKDLNLKFSPIKQDDDYYAVYFGKKRNKHISTGTSAKLTLAQHAETGKWYALKRLWTLEEAKHNMLDGMTIENRTAVNISNLAKIMTSTHVLLKRDFPREQVILKELGKSPAAVFGRQSTDVQPEQDHILMDLVNGSELFTQFTSHFKFSPRRILDLIISLLKDAESFHSRNILHRDFKSENLIYDPLKNRADWVDFGFAVKLIEGEEEYKSFERQGTPEFLAPELCMPDGELTYTKQSDIFAIGTVIAEILGFNIVTVQGSQFQTRSATIFINSHPYIKDVPDFVNQMRHNAPMMRPSLEQAIEFFRKLRQTYVKRESLRVALLDIDNYENVSKESLGIALRNSDEVLLTTSKLDVDDAKLKQVMKELSTLTLRDINRRDFKVFILNKLLYIPETPLPLKLPEKFAEEIFGEEKLRCLYRRLIVAYNGCINSVTVEQQTSTVQPRPATSLTEMMKRANLNALSEHVPVPAPKFTELKEDKSEQDNTVQAEEDKRACCAIL